MRLELKVISVPVSMFKEFGWIWGLHGTLHAFNFLSSLFGVPSLEFPLWPSLFLLRQLKPTTCVRGSQRLRSWHRLRCRHAEHRCTNDRWKANSLRCQWLHCHSWHCHNLSVCCHVCHPCRWMRIPPVGSTAGLTLCHLSSETVQLVQTNDAIALRLKLDEISTKIDRKRWENFEKSKLPICFHLFSLIFFGSFSSAQDLWNQPRHAMPVHRYSSCCISKGGSAPTPQLKPRRSSSPFQHSKMGIEKTAMA